MNKLFIAAVVRNTGLIMAPANRMVLSSGKPEGDWACFIGADLDAVVQKALEAARGWEDQRATEYEVLTGTLDSKVQVPMQYTLQALVDAIKIAPVKKAKAPVKTWNGQPKQKSGYWSQFTPEERSKEVKRRRKVAARNKKKGTK